MTRDEAVTIMQQTLGFRTDLNAQLVTMLQAAQQFLEQGPTLPWFLVSEQTTIRTALNEPRLPVPTDFLREVDASDFYYVPDDTTLDPVPLERGEYDILNRSFNGFAASYPQAYTLHGNYFRIYPVPDDTYQIRMIYYKTDTVLTSNIENAWLKHVPFLLMGTAGSKFAPGLRDKDAATTFAVWEREGRSLLNTQNVAREMANSDMQIGGAH